MKIPPPVKGKYKEPKDFDSVWIAIVGTLLIVYISILCIQWLY